MSEDELFIFILSVAAGIVGAVATSVSSLPRMYTESNPGIGLLRLAVVASVAWTAYVIQFHGDPSIQGIYVVFYLVMAYGITKVFGQLLSGIFGVSLRRDVYERRNLAAALFIAGFLLATGIIFGGSLWGEADPLSDDEGGWWIPVGFFLLGWATLVVSTALYMWFEPGPFRRQISQDRNTGMAWSTAVYMLSTSTLIFGGVAGDFWGWRHGIFGMGTIALMLVGHEFLALVGRSVMTEGAVRLVERSLYIGLAFMAWLLNRMIDQTLIPGG